MHKLVFFFLKKIKCFYCQNDPRNSSCGRFAMTNKWSKLPSDTVYKSATVSSEIQNKLRFAGSR